VRARQPFNYQVLRLELHLFLHLEPLRLRGVMRHGVEVERAVERLDLRCSRSGLGRQVFRDAGLRFVLNDEVSTRRRGGGGGAGSGTSRATGSGAAARTGAPAGGGRGFDVAPDCAALLRARVSASAASPFMGSAESSRVSQTTASS
jgi:hypothetical protein